MTTKNTLSKENLLSRAVDCVNENDSQKADQLYSNLVSDLREAYGENEKQIAADLQMLAKELEGQGLTDQAFQFKQRTCEVMLKLSMEARMRNRDRSRLQDTSAPAPEASSSIPRTRPTPAATPRKEPPHAGATHSLARTHETMLIDKLATVSAIDFIWFERFFTGPAVDFWIGAITEETTRKEVEMLKNRLELTNSCRVLDVPCGNGRHARMLSMDGYRVTGVDLSEEFIHRARAAIPRSDDENPRFTRADMAEYSRINEFDAAYCLGNSFGYLPHDRELRFLNNVAASLRTGGRFLADVSTAAECILPRLRNRDWYEAGGVQVLIANSYDAKHSILVTDYTFNLSGRTETRRALHHVYTLGEIHRMFSHCGFEVLDVAGDCEGHPFECPSNQAFIVARKID